MILHLSGVRFQGDVSLGNTALRLGHPRLELAQYLNTHDLHGRKQCELAYDTVERVLWVFVEDAKEPICGIPGEKIETLRVGREGSFEIMRKVFGVKPVAASKAAVSADT